MGIIFKRKKDGKVSVAKPDPFADIKQQMLDGIYSGKSGDLVIIDDIGAATASTKHDDMVDAVTWRKEWDRSFDAVMGTQAQRTALHETQHNAALTAKQKGERLTQLANQIHQQGLMAQASYQQSQIHAQMAAQIQQQYANQQSLMGSTIAAAAQMGTGISSIAAAGSGNVLMSNNQGSWWKDEYSNPPNDTVTHLEAKIAEQQQIIDTMRWIIETGHFAYPPEMESTVKGDKS